MSADHAWHDSWHATARERRQVRVRVPHESEGERLRFYGVREAMNKDVNGSANSSHSQRRRSTPHRVTSSAHGRNPYKGIADIFV
jgi:hypothetical protein